MRATRLAQLAWVMAALAVGCSSTGDSSGNSDRGNGSNLTPSSGAAAGKGGGTAGSDGTADTSDDVFGNNKAGMMAVELIDASTGVNETVDPDDPKCGGAEFNPEVMREVIPGNILLIADKSGSMNDPFGNGGRAKWEEARDSVANAITALQDKVNVGAVYFPDAAGCPADADCSCFVPPFASQPPQQPFTAGPTFLPLWNQNYQAQDRANTPLSEALHTADEALTASLPTLTGTTVAVIVTDGEPNCVLDGMETAAKIATLTPLPMKWLGMGVKTYVIGLPGADSAEAVEILNAVANAGGTTQHIPVTDPASVTTELNKIIGESVSSNFEDCKIPLTKQPPNLDDVNLLVTMGGMQFSVDRDLGVSGGWTLDQNAENVILQGQFCDLAKAGEYDGLTVIFGCVEVPPLPPPPPPI